MRAARASRIAFALATLGASPWLGCATVLGGLDEARPNADASDGPNTAFVDDAPSRPGADAGDGPVCLPPLAGFAHRIPFVVAAHVDAPVEAFPVPITLDTASLIADGMLRADGADLRATRGDGASSVPLWIERDLNSTATKIWVRLDLAANGTTTGWLYFGRPETTESASSLVDTFDLNAIDDPTFDRSDAWTVLEPALTAGPVSSSNSWTVTAGHGQVTLRLSRDASDNGDFGAICQSMVLPSGSLYRFAMQQVVSIAEFGAAHVFTDAPLDEGQGWATPHLPTGLGTRSLETVDLPAGRTMLCLGGAVDGSPGGQAIEVSYSLLRVRRTLI